MHNHYVIDKWNPIDDYLGMKTATNGTFTTSLNIVPSLAFNSALKNGVYSGFSMSGLNAPSCTTMYRYAFAGCINLRSVSMPLCTYLDSDIFRGCYLLSSVYAPNLSVIGDYAFQFCSSLSSIKLPSCSYLGFGAFSGCTSLSRIELLRSRVCLLYNSYVFTNTQITSTTGSIIVNGDYLTLYKSSNSWSYFWNRIFPDYTVISCSSLLISADDCAGIDTTTTVHYTAECYVQFADGTYGNKTVTGDGTSNEFSQNPSTTSSRQVEVSFTFYGVTTFTYITQGPLATADGKTPATAYSVASTGSFTANIQSTCTKSPYRNVYACWFKFTAPSTRSYTFQATTTSYTDSYGEIYNGSTTPTSSTRLAYNDDSGGNGRFKITYTCTAGVSYYIAVEYYSSSVGTIPWSIS